MRKVMLVLAVAALAVLGMSCNKLNARAELNKGVQEFTGAQCGKAVDHFKTAVELDPGFSAARLYLDTAYMQQWIPGTDSPENNKMCEAAFDNFKKVLEQEPKNSIAIASIASLNLNPKKWDEAQQWYEKLIAVEPQNADARSEEHTSKLQSRQYLVCRLLLEKEKKTPGSRVTQLTYNGHRSRWGDCHWS